MIEQLNEADLFMYRLMVGVVVTTCFLACMTMGRITAWIKEH